MTRIKPVGFFLDGTPIYEAVKDGEVLMDVVRVNEVRSNPRKFQDWILNYPCPLLDGFWTGYVYAVDYTTYLNELVQGMMGGEDV